MVTISSLSGEELCAALDDFAALLVDSVDNGGSVSFLPPLSLDTARDYWRKIADTVASGARAAWAARDGERVIGCVLLEFGWSPNGRHRGEVQKLLVHTAYRGQGISKRLMAVMEDGARAADLKLLVLDTIEGDVGEKLYERIGYTRLGVIPKFAMWNGELAGTVVFYRLL